MLNFILKALKMLVFVGVCGVLVSACKDDSKGENLGVNSQNSSKNSQNSALNLANSKDLSKYRQMYAKPVSEWEKPEIDPSVEKEWQEFALIPRPTAPADNEIVHTKSHLGKMLFNDPRLSKSGQIACESCHRKDLASADGLPRAFGHDMQEGRRNTPSSQMAAYFDEQFWDGRAKSLEEQALGPITDPVEMANTLENAVKAVKNAPEYYPMFVAAFGDEALKNAWGEYFPWVAPKTEKEEAAAKKTIHTHKPEPEPKKKPDYLGIERLDGLETLDANTLSELKEQESELYSSSGFRRLLSPAKAPQPQPKVPQNLINDAKKLITIENIAKAIASFERGPGVMGVRNTRLQRFLGGDYTALSDEELWGMDLFRNKARCMNCHYGFLLSDKKFHNIGLDLYGRVGQDLGRYEVTKNPADIGAFKTPSLVNIAKTAPYMHNGSSPNLKGLVQLFNNGVDVPAVDDANLTAIAQRDGANVAGGGILSADGTKSAANVGVERKKLVVDKDGKVLKPTKSPLIHPLNLNADEIKALEAFLKAL